MSFTDSSSDWIYSYHSGDPVSSDDVSADIPMHTNYGTTQLNLVSATGGDTANPFDVSAATSVSSGGSGGSSNSGGTGSSSTPPSNYNSVLKAHGIIGPIAFVLLYPLGAIAIRALSFPGLLWLHAGWMASTYILVLISMSLGIWLGVKSQQIDTYHAIVGLVVVGSLLVQPATGLAHHILYKRQGRPNTATYPHIWWGRAVITLGIINGGLGLRLADNTRNGEIAYGFVAGFMWLMWMVVILATFFKSRNKTKGETGDNLVGKTESRRRMRKESANSSY
jgi:hypothetical protein